MDFSYDDELIDHPYFPENQEYQVIGLFEGCQDIGYVHYKITKDILYIEMIYIEERFRKKGYANLLLDKIIKEYPLLKKVKGESILISIPFWKKKKAIFFNEKNKELYNLYPFEYSILQ